MAKTLGFQVAGLLLALLLATILSGKIEALVSALLGGFSYLVPTLVMNLVVSLIQKHKDNLFEAQLSFMVGESAKILLCVALLSASVLMYSKLIPIWFILGLICVSKFIYFIIWKFGHYGSRNRKSSS